MKFDKLTVASDMYGYRLTKSDLPADRKVKRAAVKLAFNYLLAIF